MNKEEFEKENSLPKAGEITTNASFSQFTYTLYFNGYWENLTTLTDGTVYSRNNGTWAGHPEQGDIKHRESVWRKDKWVDTVIQYY